MKKLLLFTFGLVLALAVGAQNLLTNGGFEDGTRSGWNTWNNGIQQTDVYEGLWAGQLNADVQASFLVADFTVVPGKTYDISFAAKWPDGPGTTTGISMDFQDQDKVLISGTAKIIATEWTVETAQVTIPDGITSVRVSIYKMASPVCYIDDVVITEVASSNPTPDLTLTDDGAILEDFEDGEEITVTMTNDTFLDPIVPANWTVANLPEGVTVGAITRISATEATITLSGNTTGDYDADITDMNVTVPAADFTNYEFPASVGTGVTFIATVEGGEVSVWEEDFSTFPLNTVLDSTWMAERDFTTQGEPDSIYSHDGYVAMYTNELNGQNNWFQKLIELIPGRTYTYSADLKTANGAKTLAVVFEAGPSQFKGNDVLSTEWQKSEVQFTVAADKDTVKLGVYKWGDDQIVYVDNMKLLMVTEPMIEVANDGELLEGAEDGEVITVTALYETFVASPDLANWTASVLPVGVSLGSLTRVDDTTIEITLAGNATTAYDVDIVADLTATRDEFVTSNKALTAKGLTFTTQFVPVVPVITISDDGEILEGAEDTEVITVTLADDTFAATLTAANWTVSNLPAGVSVGTVTRIGDTAAEIALSGNTTGDYDVDITDVSVTVGAAELVIYDADISVSTGVTLTATVEVASITMTDDGDISEGAEDGEVITATLVDAVFEASLTAVNWTLTNLPAGVTLGAIARIDDATAEITLAGNTTEDYDTDITNVELTVTAAEVANWVTDLTANTGVTLTAVVESGVGLGLNDGLELYPNPVVDQLRISSPTTIASVSVYNVLGVKIQEINNVNSYKLELNVEQWNAGIYFVNVNDVDGKQSVAKILK